MQLCPKCRAVYEVIEKQAPVLVEDHFDCVVCGHRLGAWKSIEYPEFHFIKKGQKPAND